MTVDDMKALLTEQMEERVTWLLDPTGKPVETISEIYTTEPTPRWQGVITMVRGSQFNFVLYRDATEWRFEANKRDKNIG